MKNYYKVTYQHAKDVFCTNIAHANSAEDVRAAYAAKYPWVDVKEWDGAEELAEAMRKGMPVIEI